MKLNFPEYDFKLKQINAKTYIYDSIRKKFIFLTPEEWVRQHVIFFLIKEIQVPASLINLEFGIKTNKGNGRTDVKVISGEGKIQLLVECKAPNISINEKTMVQISNYNYQNPSKFLMLTNGFQHFFAELNAENQYIFCKELKIFQTWFEIKKTI